MSNLSPDFTLPIMMAPQTTRPEQVAEYLAAYRNQGVNSLFFYNYGMAPLPFLEALSQ